MKKTTKKIIQIILVIVVVLGFWHVLKPLPKGIYTKGQTHHAASEDIVFLSDLTYIDSQQNRQSEQQIFDTIFTMIDEAKSYILIDMFLFNDFLGSEKKAYRGLAGELTQKLVEKKKLFPEIQIIFISDPINSVYGGDISQQYKELEKAGVTVIVTDLKKLRDSNPLYSAPWRMLGQWWGNTSDGGRLPHLMDDRRPKLISLAKKKLFILPLALL